MVFGLNGEITQPFIVNEPTVKDDTVKSDNVKENINVKEFLTIKDTPETLRKTEKDLFISELQLNELIHCLTESFNVKLEQAISKVKKELDVKYPSLYDKKELAQNTQAESKIEIPLCNGEPFAGFSSHSNKSKLKEENITVKDDNGILASNTENAITENKVDFTVKENEQAQSDQAHLIEFPQEEESEEESEEQENQNDFYGNASKVKDSNETDTVTEPFTKTGSVKDVLCKKAEPEILIDQKYEPFQSVFCWDIEEHSQSIQEHFDFSSDDPAIKWLSLRLRCILENAIRFTEYASIDKESFTKLTNALNKLIDSHSWNNISHYFLVSRPLTELADRMNDLVNKNKKETIPLRISLKLKAHLVAIREQLKETVEKIPFNELDFSEPHYQAKKINGLNGNKTENWD